jgi:two-component system, cell cycle sensor histidine kinase and response regulator CckA
MLRRFTIRQVVIGAMAAVSVVAFICVVALLLTAASMGRAAEIQSTRLVADEEVADRIVQHVQQQLGAAERYILSGHEQYLEEFREEGYAVYDQIRTFLFSDPGTLERLLVERIRERHQIIEVAAQRLFAAGTAAGSAADLPGVRELQNDLASFIELRRAETQRTLEWQHAVWRWLYLACGLLGMLFAGALAAFAIFLRHRLLEPLAALSSAAQRVGVGDFDARVEYSGADELADVATSFNHMAENLQHARRAAQTAEHRFRELVEGISAIVWEADAATLTCSYVSPQAEQLFGYPLARWADAGIWTTIIHPDDVEESLEICARSAAAGEDHAIEFRAVKANGDVVWVRDFVRVLLDDQGRPDRLRGVMTDVTETRRADEALRVSQLRYHSLFESVPVGLYRTTPDGTMIEANAALVAMLGYTSRAELLGRNAVDVYVDVADRQRWQDMLDRAGGVVEVDRQHRRRDGALIWLRDTARAIRDDSGVVQYYEGALQDVTDRVDAEEAMRRSEARFRSLIENASEGVLILSAEGLIVYLSPAVERMLGYPPDLMIGRTPFELVHPDDLGDVQESFVNVMSPEGHGKSVEFRCRHYDGSWRVLHIIGTDLRHDPAVNGIVVNMIDTTTHRSLEQQLHHSQRLEAVGRLAGGIAHDFNNLLTAIRGYTDLLDDNVRDDARAHADVVEIRRAVERASRLTRQLLAFSRRQVVRPQATDLAVVLTELQQMLRRLLTEEIALRTNCAPGAWVFADPGQLEQIIVNLVVNARDAHPRSAITIDVSTAALHGAAAATARVDPGAYVILKIMDDGMGIDADVLPHIFEPFFTTKEVGRGTGLGLSTVYGIVQDAGGVIGVESSLEAGTTMSVYLPRIAEPLVGNVASPVDDDEPEHGNELILLVEDEAAVRSLAERILLRHGYQVLTAASGVEALALLASAPGQIDLLVTDVVMPEMGGVELAERMLELRPDTRVLFISGYAADTLPQTDVQGRTLHFLEKPFSPARFAETIRRILDEAAQPA